MNVRNSNGNVYYAAVKVWPREDGRAITWEVDYVGESILEASASFDRMSEGGGTNEYCSGWVDAKGNVIVRQYFSNCCGWDIGSPSGPAVSFYTLKEDVTAAIRECEEAIPMGG